MIFNIYSTRGQTGFLACVARVTCLVYVMPGIYQRFNNVTSNVSLIAPGITTSRLSQTCQAPFIHLTCQFKDACKFVLLSRQGGLVNIFALPV